MSSEAKGVVRPARFNNDWKPPTSKKTGTLHGRAYSGPPDQSGPQVPTSVIDELRKRATSQEPSQEEIETRRALLERLRQLPRSEPPFPEEDQKTATVHVVGQRGSAPASPRKNNQGARIRSLTPDGRKQPGKVDPPSAKESPPTTARRSIWSLFSFGSKKDKQASNPPTPRRPLPVPPNHGRDPSLGELDKPDLSLVEDDPKNESAWGKICDLPLFNDVNQFNVLKNYASEELEGLKDRLSPAKKSTLRVILQLYTDYLNKKEEVGFIESLRNQTLNDCAKMWITPKKFPDVKALKEIILQVESRAKKWGTIHGFFMAKKNQFAEIVKYIKGDLQKEEFDEEKEDDDTKKLNADFKRALPLMLYTIQNAQEHYTTNHNLQEAVQRSLNAITLSHKIAKGDPAPEATFDQLLDGLVLVVEKLTIKFPIPDPQGQRRGSSSSTQP